MLTPRPQGMLLFQQPVGKNKADGKRAPGAKSRVDISHSIRGKPKLKVSRLTTISGAVNETLRSWYTYVYHESKSALAPKQPVPGHREEASAFWWRADDIPLNRGWAFRFAWSCVILIRTWADLPHELSKELSQDKFLCNSLTSAYWKVQVFEQGQN